MCEYCGHDHPRDALCTQRPKWGRRGFLALLGAAAVGATVPDALADVSFGFTPGGVKVVPFSVVGFMASITEENGVWRIAFNGENFKT